VIDLGKKLKMAQNGEKTEVGGDEEEEEEEKEAEYPKEEVGDMEWEELVKSGGSVSFIEPNKEDSAGWLSPPGHSFQVRGPQYLTTKVKIAGSEPFFKPLAFDWLKSGSRIDSILEHPNSRVRSALDRATATEEAAGVSKKKKPFVWAFNLQVSFCFFFFLLIKLWSFPQKRKKLKLYQDQHHQSMMELLYLLVTGFVLLKPLTVLDFWKAAARLHTF
jgi:hypothetical protein